MPGLSQSRSSSLTLATSAKATKSSTWRRARWVVVHQDRADIGVVRDGGPFVGADAPQEVEQVGRSRLAQGRNGAEVDQVNRADVAGAEVPGEIKGIHGMPIAIDIGPGRGRRFGSQLRSSRATPDSANQRGMSCRGSSSSRSELGPPAAQGYGQFAGLPPGWERVEPVGVPHGVDERIAYMTNNVGHKGC